MTKYLKKIEERSEYNAYKDSSAFTTPNVSAIVEEIESGEDGVVFNPYVHDYSKDYFTTVAKSDGTITFSGSTSNTISYSTDSGATWSELAQNPSVTVSSGQTVLWKGNCVPNSSNGIGRFSGGTATFDVEGNAMSLLFGDNFIGQTSLTSKDYAFYRLFNGNTKLESAENLSLPATTLTIYCYQEMFNGCTSLTTAPQLLATTLGQGCYSYMFCGCSSLTTAPQLPATTLANNCYQSMFQGCTSLTTAPQLPATILADSCYEGMFASCTSLTMAPQLLATTLADYCYQYMFGDCTSLNSITCLATDISASNCTRYWVSGVASSGTFTKADSMTSWTSGPNGIPSGWTVQDAN